MLQLERPIASINDSDMVGFIQKARRIIEDLEYYEQSLPNKTTMQIIYEFLKKNKLLKSLRAPTTQLEEQQGRNIAKFLKLVGNVEKKLKTSLPAFVIPYLKRIEMLWSELVEEEARAFKPAQKINACKINSLLRKFRRSLLQHCGT